MTRRKRYPHSSTMYRHWVLLPKWREELLKKTPENLPEEEKL
jgi:hypothetical protein